jgi:hypothetical protein
VPVPEARGAPAAAAALLALASLQGARRA